MGPGSIGWFWSIAATDGRTQSGWCLSLTARGDADSFSSHFATDGTFTNILGIFFSGRQVRGYAALPEGVSPMPDGTLRMKLLLVLIKEHGDWWITAFHNVAVAPSASKS